MSGQILFVDDDPTFTSVAADLIRVDGHTVLTAGDGVEALELLRAGEFDVVLTDYQMPRMNGIELIRAVKQIDPTLEVIVITGYGSVSLAVDIIRSGGFDLLQKPDDVKNRMRMTVNQALEKRRLNRDNNNLVEMLEQQIIDKTSESRRLAAQYQVTSILTETDALADAAPRILKTLLDIQGWEYGAIWTADRFTDQLHCKCICSKTDATHDPLVVKRHQQVFRIGEGLPGRVWAENSILLDVESHWKTSDYTMQSIGFPVMYNERMQGVIEFHHSEISEPDENLVYMMTAICSQLGLFIEREQLEQQFRQSQKLEAIGRLAGGISHDFNNLLTSIMGYAHLIEGQVADHEILHRNARQIQKTTDRAASLIEQLLTLSRSQVMKPDLCNLNKIILDLQPMLSRLLTESIDIHTDLQEQAGPVIADKTQIEQVIVNLAVNARDAMMEGGRLTIETRVVSLDNHDAKMIGLTSGEYIELKVIDTGHGMDESVKAHLFEPFFTTKEIGKGSGLGLATVYGIISQSNGNIDVQSSPGEGSSFSIYLPLASDAPADLEKQSDETVNTADSVDVDETILIVDDALDIREIMQNILETEGYTVYTANDGLDALNVMKQHHSQIDLVITDIYMPKMMGDALIQQIGDSYPDKKILIISGMSKGPLEKQADIINRFPFLPKPYSPEALLKKVRDILEVQV